MKAKRCHFGITEMGSGVSGTSVDEGWWYVSCRLVGCGGKIKQHAK